MIRATLAVLAGYAAMFALVFATFSGAYTLMGADRAFQPGTYDVSRLWLGTSIALGLAGAVAGGLVCSLVATRGSRATTVLACLVLVLGVAMAVPAFLAADASEPRAAEVGNSEAMMKARTPAFAAALNPLIGAAGVLAGAKLGRRTGAGNGDREGPALAALP